MKLFTIGFTKTSAQQFFTALAESGASRLLDVRLNNVSQLAGFAKRDDLRYFLREICAMEYTHELRLAPPKDLLDSYRRTRDWATYESKFLELLADREVEKAIPPVLVDNAVLLCSEAEPHHCHRRLAAEYLRSHWPIESITHL